jgi:hypothetical protein
MTAIAFVFAAFRINETALRRDIQPGAFQICMYLSGE